MGKGSVPSLTSIGDHAEHKSPRTTTHPSAPHAERPVRIPPPPSPFPQSLSHLPIGFAVTDPLFLRARNEGIRWHGNAVWLINGARLPLRFFFLDNIVHEFRPSSRAQEREDTTSLPGALPRRTHVAEPVDGHTTTLGLPSDLSPSPPNSTEHTLLHHPTRPNFFCTLSTS